MRRLTEIIALYKTAALLDVACETGGHIPYLRQSFAVEVLISIGEMLNIAGAKLPDVSFHEGDMIDFG